MGGEGAAMRLFLTAVAIATLAGPANAATRNVGVSGFDRIRVEGPFRVKLSTGVAPFATATANSSGALEGVAIEVQGRTLIVRANRQSWGGYPGEAAGPVDISIGTHELTAAWLNGSGTMAIDKLRGLSFDLSVQGSGAVSVAAVEVDQFKAAVSGTAAISLAGTALKLTATVNGVSMLQASGLSAKDATFNVSGPATVRAMVTGTAKVSASGPASVELSGGPACTIRATGSSNVSGCR
jgi:hypothetical protein